MHKTYSLGSATLLISLVALATTISLDPLVVLPTPLVHACDQCGFLLAWGSRGSGNGQFWGPSGIALDKSGNVYVADYINHRIQKFDSSGNYLAQWGSQGSGNGQLAYPTDVSVDSSGYVYVLDRNNGRVEKFTSTGTYITQWGSLGTGSGQLNYPTGIVVDPSGNVYVADILSGRVKKFDGSGRFLLEWSSSAISIAVDSHSDVYVADFWGNRVQKFTSTGTYITQWGSLGTGNGQFKNPDGIAVDSAGNVYVTDRNNTRVEKFTSSGAYLTQWDLKVPGGSNYGGGYNIAADSLGNLYVTDLNNNRVLKFGDQLSLTSQNTSQTSVPVTTQSGPPTTTSVSQVSTPAIGKIAFISERDGNFEIYTMNSDGSSVTRLTNNPAYDQMPAWSPDGSKIAFVSSNQIYVMNSDGSSVTRLTNGASYDGAPSWSPDGSKIAFDSNREVPGWIKDPRNYEIYVMNADGSGQTRLTSGAAHDMEPSWSPDGSKIAFSNDREGQGLMIYVMNADGSGKTRLTYDQYTTHPVWSSSPVWSPDGSRIAFCSAREEGIPRIYVMNADGSGQTKLTDSSGQERDPSWQPVMSTTVRTTSVWTSPTVARTSSTAVPKTVSATTNISSVQNAQSLSNVLPWVTLVAIAAVVGFFVSRKRGRTQRPTSTAAVTPSGVFDISISVPSVSKTVTLEVAADHTVGSLIETIAATVDLPKGKTCAVAHEGKLISETDFGKTLGSLGIRDGSKLTLRLIE